MAFRPTIQAGIEKLTHAPEEAMILGSATRDAFGRSRVSTPLTIFDDKHTYAKNDGTNGVPNWIYDVAGSGSATYKSNESAVDLTCTTGSTDRAIKRTFRYFPYIPGKSQLAILTAVVGAGETGVEKRLGLFDDDDGVYFYEIDGVYGIGLRSKVTGSIVETHVAKTDWNIDPLDGTGPTRITADFTKGLIFIIDLQWLGVGAIRFCMDIDGKTIPVHAISIPIITPMFI